MERRILRVLLCKGTMDAHDRGVRYLATKLREAGMEVIFINFLEPSEIVDAAIQEDVDVVGVSSSVEGHLPVARELTRRLAAQGRADVLVLFGGVIPERDFPAMRELGVEGVFGPGSTADSVIAFVRERARAVRPRFA
ncbi:MAG: cobalamin-dependent protein [Burkholderiales bacterium]|nr:cobalamin-dependent protein [Burkholderiales bacterium]MCC7116300.1 cobalamin-dependent protein [Burkholderiales bacterium]